MRSPARLRACHAHGGRFVIRLKDTWKPKVAYLARGHLTQEFCPGTDLAVLLEQEILVLKGHPVDADGRVGRTKQPVPLRLVGVHTPKGYGFFLTTLPPRLGPRQVAARSRVRWEVERSITRDQSVHRLDQIDAERACSVKTLLHASRIASTIAALLAHIHQMQTRPAPEGEPRTEAPLPPRRLALPLAVSGQSMAQAFDRKGVAAKRRWQQSAALRTHSGRAPHWRRRPSVWDQLRGWKRQPVLQHHTNRRHFTAAASVDTYAPYPSPAP
jgi:hypothetical protein